MPLAARVFIAAVIVAGIITIPFAALPWNSPSPVRFAVLVGLSIAASAIKLRLPGIDGVYSLGFFFILVGLCYFTLPETVAAAVAAAVAGTILNRERRPTPVQTLFNIANLVLSIAACHLLLVSLRPAGLEAYLPVVLASVAFLYFVVNTVIVSGVLSLLQGKPLLSVCGEWYFWSFPYYLVGVIVVGLLPLAGQPVQPAGWLAVMPPLYLLHFFLGLSRGRRETGSTDDAGGLHLPRAAITYIGAVGAAGVLLLGWSILHWDTAGWIELLTFLVIAVPVSVLKIRLPGVTGTVSLNFVLLLLAMAELNLPQVVFVAGVSAVVQSIWGSDYRPAPVQVVFNTAVLITSSGLAYGAFHWSQVAFGQVILVSLVVATAVLYFTNTLLVAVVLCLVEKKPLGQIWANCYYWSFPYYLVGAGFAAVMSSVYGASGWMVSFLALPLMALVYLSYRLHLNTVSDGSLDG